jgi:DNA replication protein DnaC
MRRTNTIEVARKTTLSRTHAGVDDPSYATAVSRWHEQIGGPTLADGVLDRLVHNAHRIDLRGDSMRKNRGKPNS